MDASNAVRDSKVDGTQLVQGEKAKIRKNVDYIPEGASEHNDEGFYLDGNYATVRNEYDEIFLELNMFLHHNGKPTVHEGIYMVWMQVIDPLKSNDKTGDYYEGFSCAVRYDESVKPLIRSNYLFRVGYVGSNAMEYELGDFESLLEADQVEEYPWLL